MKPLSVREKENQMERIRSSISSAKVLGALAAALILAPGGALADPSESESGKRPFTTDFGACSSWVNDDTGLVSNPYWIPLIPGNQATLEDEEVTVVITVCDAACPDTTGTEVVDGVTTRVIEEREWEDGVLVEVSRNFFARCEDNGSILYFGEDVDDYDEDGNIVGHEGAWRAGVDDAEAGVIMPGHFLLGARYFQEIAPDVALDRGENEAMGLEVEVPYLGGTTFVDCVQVFETSGLHSSDRSVKRYCPGVGLVFDDGIELTDKNY
jgi:hypothetical protein